MRGGGGGGNIKHNINNMDNIEHNLIQSIYTGMEVISLILP